MEKSAKYNRGYNSAITVLDNNQRTAQELLNDSYHALEEDDFDKGWQQACIDRGAVIPE